ncbi:peptide/nickel transport system substrate-binding protein [Ilumatobacter fluminis]|uniref:Peptide/nickel transport system substrate-binding protein n=1 Tax=Ilumatobacter fluminis TaxID=467091 RepID=A0A4R7HXN3_9ACTN|nr:peptide/nickel transport system substrate-binding protein [Ilumatobacter fluminis]
MLIVYIMQPEGDPSRPSIQKGDEVKKRTRAVALALSLSLVAVACGGSDDDDGADDAPADTEAGSGDDAAETDDGGTSASDAADDAPVDGAAVVIALGSEPTSLDPHLVEDGSERAINDNVYESLLTRTPDGEIIPGLASALPTQVDETTWQFTLNEGVVFHNGEEFNADSVVASVERMLRLIGDGVTDLDGYYSIITGAEAVDATTVNITTAEPDGVLPARMTWLKMIPPSSAESDDLSDTVVGTGPYEFVEWVRGERVDLVASGNYWGDTPSVAEAKYTFVSESGSRFAGLLSGDYDLITNLSPADVGQAPQVAAVQGQEHPIIILDADEGITADVNVRTALNLAVDKEAIAESLFGGFAAVDPGQLLSESILGFNPDLEAYPYDPDQAQQLIQDAGVAGETITLVGESSGRWLLDAELLQAVAGYWEDAGLTVDLQLPEFGEYLDVLFDRDSRADAIFVSSSNDILDADRQLSTYYQAGGIGSSNSDADLAELIDQGRSTLDEAERESIYQQAVAVAYDQAYFVWLINNQDIYGLSERMEWTPRVDSKILLKEMAVSG